MPRGVYERCGHVTWSRGGKTCQRKAVKLVYIKPYSWQRGCPSPWIKRCSTHAGYHPQRGGWYYLHDEETMRQQRRYWRSDAQDD